MNLTTIRKALAEHLQANLSGPVKAYWWRDLAVQIPGTSDGLAVLVIPGDPAVSPDAAMAKGLVEVRLQVVAMVNTANSQLSEERCDELISSGALAGRSILDAVEVDRTLGGVVFDAYVESMSSPGLASFEGETTLATVTWWQVTVDVMVRAART